MDRSEVMNRRGPQKIWCYCMSKKHAWTSGWPIALFPEGGRSNYPTSFQAAEKAATTVMLTNTFCCLPFWYCGVVADSQLQEFATQPAFHDAESGRSMIASVGFLSFPGWFRHFDYHGNGYLSKSELLRGVIKTYDAPWQLLKSKTFWESTSKMWQRHFVVSVLCQAGGHNINPMNQKPSKTTMKPTLSQFKPLEKPLQTITTTTLTQQYSYHSKPLERPL